MSAEVFEPGIYDMPEHIYHADPVPGGSLSSTGARRLLPPSCPAKYKTELAAPRDPAAVLDLGTAAHSLLLGAGKKIVVVQAEDWRTKAAKDERDQARGDGHIPVLTADWDRINAMQDALRAHPLASAALDPARGGKPEQSLFARDGDSGVWLRARLDWMPDPHSAMRPVIFDYKTSRSANPASFAKSMADFGYHIQAAFYADLYHHLTGVDAPFLFIVQEKEPPFLVTVCQPDANAVRAGRDQYRQAIDIYRNCTETGQWPGYPADIHEIKLPPWVQSLHERREELRLNNDPRWMNL